MVNYAQQFTLAEAEQAAKMLGELTKAAEALPMLRQQDAKRNSQVRLENLRVKVLEENTMLYQQYTEALATWQQAFRALLEQTEATRKTLSTLLQYRQGISQNVGYYGNALMQHAITHEGMNIYKNALELEQRAKSDCPLPGPLLAEDSLYSHNDKTQTLLFRACVT